MSGKVNTDVVDNVANQILELGTTEQVKRGPVHHVSLKGTLGLYEGQGVEQKVMRAVASAEATILNGAAVAAHTLLTKRVQEAKEKGEDPSSLTQVVTLQDPNGRTEVRAKAVATGNDPRGGGQVTTYGQTGIHMRRRSVLDKGRLSELGASMEALVTK